MLVAQKRLQVKRAAAVSVGTQRDFEDLRLADSTVW
jgi:hypothetical protein